MRSASKLRSPHSLLRPPPAGLSSRSKSSLGKSSSRRPPPAGLSSRSKSSLGKSSSRRPPPASPPSLYEMITEIVPIRTRDPDQQAAKSTQVVCQNARDSISASQAIETGKTLLKAPDLDEISAVVHKVTEIIRSNNIQFSMERRLDELGISFTPEIVEMVLKRCFKVGNLALRFFNWMKLRPRFCHTTETYNTMAYIAGEAGEFDLLEKLMEDMDADLCSKDIKTWTILISQYANAKKIGKALWTFEEMRKSGCKLDGGVYEAVLRGLFSVRKAELAFEFYKEMVLKKMKIDIKIYTMLMDSLSISGDIPNVRLVAEDMMKIAELPETEVLTIMLRSFCISGRVDEARKLFEEMKARNMSVDSTVYEVLVKGLCRAGRMDQAMEIVNEMKRSLIGGSRIYGCLIDGFLRTGNARKALELLHSMRELGCLPMVSSYTQVIQHLFRSDQYGKACEIYKEMLGNGVEVDIVATTAVVAGHVQHSNISEAWRVFNGMKSKGKVPTWKAYSIFIKELCKASKPNEAFKLLIEMSACNINPTDYIFRLVTSSLTKNGELEKARTVEQQCRSFRFSHKESEQLYHFSEPRPSHEDQEVSACSSDQNSVSRQPRNTFNESDVEELCRILSKSAISELLLQSLDRSAVTLTPELVEAVLRRSQRHGRAALKFFSWVGKQPNYSHTTETYNMAIKIAGSGKDFKHMRNLYLEMKRRRCFIEPNTWTIMISQYGQAGLTEIALNTFMEMKDEGYQPNGATFKYLIIFLCGKKGRKVEEAIKILHEMLTSGFMPDKEMVDIFLSSLCESRKVSEARTAVDYLCKRGFQDQIGYSLLLKSLCRAGQVEEGIILADEFEKLGCKVDQFIYSSIVHALLRRGRVDEALDKLECMRRAGISQSVHVNTSLIVHFFKKRQVEKAVEIYKKMREEGCEPTVSTYSALLHGYVSMGMFSEAWNIFLCMKVRGPLPDFQTYSVFMSCLCKQGKSEDGFKLIQDMVESQIIPSAINFRTVYYGLNREGKQELALLVLKMKWNLKKERMLSI